MFPIADDNPTRTRPVVTYGLIGLNIVVSLWQWALPPEPAREMVYALGMIPAVLFGSQTLPPEIALVPAWMTIFTSMFLHGGLLHLAGNMLFLWIFADNVEEAMGRAPFVVFYLLCGIGAALGQALLDPGSTVPMVGASGAISGVLGAYILLYPHATVRTIVIFGFFVQLLHVPAYVVLGLWFAIQLASGLMSPAGEAGVAFWAHIGGFLAGLALVPLFRRRHIALLQPRRAEPWARERVTRMGPWGPRE
ncbi:MAG: rhomboid family intramembrane serine protease [Alphaproteobacteria bacterium]|nr:rhomboid family intramembrane serine protease [Alphaproteobacteria bacterium]